MATHSSNTYLEWYGTEMTDNAEYIYSYFKSKGWTKNAICAMLGNMQRESGINPGLWESLDYGNYSGGYGLVQWTPATNLINWCNSNNLDHSQMDSQLARIMYELNNGIQWIATSSYPESFSEFTQSTASVDYLTRAFLANYERAGVSALSERLQHAEYWYNNLSGSGGTVHIGTNIPFHSEFTVTSLFGWRLHPIYGDYRLHKGIDLVGTDTTEYATCNGIVVLNEWSDSYGWHVLIKDTSAQYGEYYHHFCHLASQSSLQIGQTVDRNTVVGIMGATGNVTGAHLHYEITKQLYSNDESDYMNPAEYMGIPNETGTYNWEDYPVEYYDDDTPSGDDNKRKKYKRKKVLRFRRQILVDIHL